MRLCALDWQVIWTSMHAAHSLCMLRHGMAFPVPRKLISLQVAKLPKKKPSNAIAGVQNSYWKVCALSDVTPASFSCLTFATYASAYGFNLSAAACAFIDSSFAVSQPAKAACHAFIAACAASENPPPALYLTV